jgi:transposase
MIKLRQGIQIYVSLAAINRSRDKTKILFWDRNGYTLQYKRMEKHRFVVPSVNSQSQIMITETQLNGLLAGLNFEIMGDFVEIEYDKIF